MPAVAGGDEGEYVLQVSGESMRDAGILAGDYVVVRRQDTAQRRRHRRGAARRRGDREALLPGERPRAPAAREPVDGADPQPRRAGPRPGRGSLQEGLMPALEEPPVIIDAGARPERLFDPRRPHARRRRCARLDDALAARPRRGLPGLRRDRRSAASSARRPSAPPAAAGSNSAVAGPGAASGRMPACADACLRARLHGRPPISREAWLRLAACAGAAALLQMDGTIVTVALPSVGDELGADSHELS